jgi:hypothetical protein
MFRYHLGRRELEEVTPDDPLVGTTLGIRSAGSLGPWVILAGPGIGGGINLFAFHAGSRRYLGSAHLAEYDNIRKWIVHKGVLYTAVGRSEGGGAVLRWLPRGAHRHFPFRFEVVGEIDGAGAELAVHDGRLFVSSWPDLAKFVGGGQLPPTAGLWMSPPIPKKGLTAADAPLWQKVWNADDYEPDPVVAISYGGGALASFAGDLYWGSMHVPFLSARLFFLLFGEPQDLATYFDWVINSSRAISIFRGRDFGTPDQEVELLYGEEELPVFNFLTRTWSPAPNAMGAFPLYGGSGFGHPFNNYTWIMLPWRKQLLVGTMDYGILVQGLLEELSGTPLPPLPLDEETFGADLYRFPSGDEPALAESLTGVGNRASYGVRTAVGDRHAVYLGMANPMNLLTDLSDDQPEGGWELLKLTTPGCSPGDPEILKLGKGAAKTLRGSPPYGCGSP